MTSEGSRLWTDRSGLRQGQYRTDANLAARQSLYAYQHPPIDLPAAVLDLADAASGESVADIGCGNGAYLAELARRWHTGPVLGVDLSLGMLAAARRRVPAAALVAGDACALPLRDHTADLTLAPHMLYHVADLQGAVAELRRITRPGGTVLVVLNGHDHLRELDDLVTAVLQDAGRQAAPRAHPRLEDGQALLASQFASVTRHDFISELSISAPEPVEKYVRSTIGVQNQPDPDAIAAAVASRFPARDGIMHVRAHTGCLVCT